MDTVFQILLRGKGLVGCCLSIAKKVASRSNPIQLPTFGDSLQKIRLSSSVILVPDI